MGMVVGIWKGTWELSDGTGYLTSVLFSAWRGSGVLHVFFSVGWF